MVQWLSLIIDIVYPSNWGESSLGHGSLGHQAPIRRLSAQARHKACTENMDGAAEPVASDDMNMVKTWRS